MPLTKDSPVPPTLEKNGLPTPPEDESPPPAYRQTAEEAPPDITAAFSNLNLASSDFPTSDQCLAHLKFLETLYQLREDIETRDGLFGVKDSFNLEHEGTEAHARVVSTIRQKRWAVYVSKAAQRFEKWWTHAVQPGAERLNGYNMTTQLSRFVYEGKALKFEAHDLPPLDVLMVWHAYLLNPRDCLEDCLRYGKLDFWRAGFPWEAVNASIDNNTFEYTASRYVKTAWTQKTGCVWESLEDLAHAVVKCPMCMKDMSVPWTGYTRPGDFWRDGADVHETLANGFADKTMRYVCQYCSTVIRHDDLKLEKFWLDYGALKNPSMKYPMPGTVLTVDGIPDPVSMKSREMQFPNHLLTIKDPLLESRIRSRTSPGQGWKSMDGIRIEIEELLKDRNVRHELVGTVSGGYKKGERIAIRRMMSRYWDNFSPFALDLVGAVIRQGSFIEKMHSIDWIHSPAATSTMKRLITKYDRYMHIIAWHPSHVAVPTLDVDLAWHTHQLSPASYYHFTTLKTNNIFIDHDDKIDETKLSDSFEWTSKTYQKKYKELYSECTCWYCEAIRESHTSSLSRVLSTSNPTIDDQLENLHAAPAAGFGPHISAHNAIRPATQKDRSIKEKALKAKLEREYQKAVKRATKAGRPLPDRKAYTPYPAPSSTKGEKNKDAPNAGLAYGYYPLIFPFYAPYMGDPTVCGDNYAANPACATFVSGASGNCAAGSCGGGVAAGACGGGAGGVRVEVLVDVVEAVAEEEGVLEGVEAVVVVGAVEAEAEGGVEFDGCGEGEREGIGGRWKK
ncbi:uncharacterized protein KY384_001321 [Bacidia gigantensis]|uniref:uncharacterized protein n=1 Tax=Bacidia gigantensis TaxID=2732470 RepID=UPI001D03E843|nr:uncharacterized protein KY384_001321 [Bacidia gigantensis]KAG8533581.1 hypothetical protein KY384_001321 [Bacidia gigantensis]